MKKSTRILSVLLTMVMLVTLFVVAVPTTASAATPYVYINKASASYMLKDSNGYVYVELGTNVRFWINMTGTSLIDSNWIPGNAEVLAPISGGRFDQRGDFLAKKVGTCIMKGSTYSSREEDGSPKYYTDKVTYKIRVVKKGAIKTATPKITKIAPNTAGAGATITFSTQAARNRIFYKGSNGKWAKLGDSNTATYTDTTLKPGVTRVYTVRSLGAYGNFISSYDTAGRKFSYTLATPKITSFNDEGTGLRVSWKNVPGAAKVRLLRKDGSKWTKIGDSTGTSLVDKTAVNGKKYTYTVRCLSADGKSFESGYNKTGWSHTYVQPCPLLTKFFLIDDEANGCQTLNFAVDQDSAEIAQYAFFIKQDGKWLKCKFNMFEEGNLFGYPSDKFFLEASSLHFGDEYTMTIRGVDKNGKYCTGYSKEGWVVHPMKKVSGIARWDSDRIGWNPSAGATRYLVEVSTPYFQTLGFYWTDIPEITNEVFDGIEVYLTVTPYDKGVCGGESVTTYVPLAYG